MSSKFTGPLLFQDQPANASNFTTQSQLALLQRQRLHWLLPNGEALELAATGPKQGATFYTLSQQKEAQPEFIRYRGNCFTCHATGCRQNVPSYLMWHAFPAMVGPTNATH